MLANEKPIHADILFEEVKHQLALGNKAKFRITGASMWPFLCHERDSVVLEAAADRKIRVGDIVLLYKPDGAYLVHRVTAVKAAMLQTTGDFLLYRDGWFQREAVIGRAHSIIRNGRVIRCDDLTWKTMMDIWRVCFPIRKYLLNLLLLMSKIKCTVNKKRRSVQ